MNFKTSPYFSNMAALLAIVVTLLYGLRFTLAQTCQLIETANADVNVPYNATAQQYLDLNRPVVCNGVITWLHFCYHISDEDRGQTQSVVLQVWREIDNSTFSAVSAYVLSVEISQQNVISPAPSNVECHNRTLNESDYIEVLQDDVLGVYYPESVSPSRLQLVFTTQSVSTPAQEAGLYFDDGNVVNSTLNGSVIDTDQLKFNSSLVLHLSAEIDQKQSDMGMPSSTVMPTTQGMLTSSTQVQPLVNTDVMTHTTTFELTTQTSIQPTRMLMHSSTSGNTANSIQPTIQSSVMSILEITFHPIVTTSTLAISDTMPSKHPLDTLSLTSVELLPSTLLRSPTQTITSTDLASLDYSTGLIFSSIRPTLQETQSNVMRVTSLNPQSTISDVRTLIQPTTELDSTSNVLSTGIPSSVTQSKSVTYVVVQTPNIHSSIVQPLTPSSTTLLSSRAQSINSEPEKFQSSFRLASTFSHSNTASPSSNIQLKTSSIHTPSSGTMVFSSDREMLPTTSSTFNSQLASSSQTSSRISTFISQAISSETTSRTLGPSESSGSLPTGTQSLPLVSQSEAPVRNSGASSVSLFIPSTETPPLSFTTVLNTLFETTLISLRTGFPSGVSRTVSISTIQETSPSSTPNTLLGRESVTITTSTRGISSTLSSITLTPSTTSRTLVQSSTALLNDLTRVRSVSSVDDIQSPSISLTLLPISRTSESKTVRSSNDPPSAAVSIPESPSISFRTRVPVSTSTLVQVSSASLSDSLSVISSIDLESVLTETRSLPTTIRIERTVSTESTSTLSAVPFQTQSIQTTILSPPMPTPLITVPLQTSTAYIPQPELPTTPLPTHSMVPSVPSETYISAIIAGTTAVAVLLTALMGCAVITCMIIMYKRTKLGVTKVKTVASSESTTPLSLDGRHFSIDNPNYSGLPTAANIARPPPTPTLNDYTNHGFRNGSKENLLSNSDARLYHKNHAHSTSARVPSDYETPIVIISNQNSVLLSPAPQRKAAVVNPYSDNFPNNKRSVSQQRPASDSPDFALKPYKIVHIMNGTTDYNSTPKPHEYSEPFNSSPDLSKSFRPRRNPSNGIPTRVSDYEVPVFSPLPPPHVVSKNSLELAPLHSEDVLQASTNESEYIFMVSDFETLRRHREKYADWQSQESEQKVWNDRSWDSESSDLALTSSMKHEEHLDSNRVSSSMDGPYCSPPSKEEAIYEVLSQIGVENISKENIRTHLVPNSAQTHIKSEWRFNKGTPWLEVDMKVISKEEKSELIVSDRIKLLQEAAIVAQFRHPNVMKLHGIVTEGDTIMLVTEHFQKGDLRKCLVQMGRSVVPPDTPKLLLNYSQQVALGMHYLSCKGFVHKDLAARSIFVTKDDVCKVGEFSKSRDLSNAGHYIASGGKIPVRWTSPEAMYYQKYSTTSDTWSYGCLLYEIWSLGRMPFREFTNAEVIKKIDSGYRLPPPPGCPRAIYETMIQCWDPKPLSRPTFKDIINTLLAEESRVLQIPVSDASTHESAIILGAPLEVGEYMYTDLQSRYLVQTTSRRRPLTNSQSAAAVGVKGTKKHSDYDHITGQKYVMSFPTSSEDIECMYKGPLSRAVPSAVPKPRHSPNFSRSNVNGCTRTDHTSQGPNPNGVTRKEELPPHARPKIGNGTGHMRGNGYNGETHHTHVHCFNPDDKVNDDASDYEDIDA